MAEDEQHQQAFGEHTGLCREARDCINGIKNNHYGVNELKISSSDAEKFTDLAWRLLGRYIANNSHLEKVFLIRCGITDEKMASLFYELTYSSSLKDLYLCHNNFGIDGVRSMIPFLNDTNLSHLNFFHNNNFDTDCLELLVSTLHGRPLESISLNSLYISSCSITNISALDTYTLSDLQTLNLNGNNIGREGCIILSKLLQKEGTVLEELDLNGTGIEDEDVVLIASSLKHNTTLEQLRLKDNNGITERGYGALLKVLVDISSIENTYNSNHTLTILCLARAETVISRHTSMIEHINSAVKLNKLHQSFHAAGRAKVIKYQLNNQNRKEACQLQGIEYLSIGNLFANIEPILLPRILALIGREHGQSEFYAALIPMVPDLMSYVDTSGMIKDEMAKNEAHDNDLVAQIAELTRQRAALSAKNDQLSRRLAAKQSGDSHHSTIEEGSGETAAESGKKRQRSEE